MRILVVYSHPVEGSFSSVVRDTVLAALHEAGHETVLHDLYEEKFDPVLSCEERLSYFDPARGADATVEAHLHDLRTCDGIVFVYPTWWHGLPAMLKGYFDRVWLPGVAFTISPSGDIDTQRLSHVRHVAVVTTYGGSWRYTTFLLGDPGKRLFERGLRIVFSPRCRITRLALYGMDRARDQDRQRFLHKVAERMRDFERRLTRSSASLPLHRDRGTAFRDPLCGR